jgi:hypothetical protein
MSKKFKPELLKEELKKFRLLSEYDFYTEKKEPVTYADDKDLLLGTELEEADEDPNAAPADAAPVEEPAEDPNAAPEMPAEEPVEAPAEEPMEPEMPAEPASNDVEVDVTELVKGSEEAKNAADEANKNTEVLLNKLNDLEARIANMDAITNKIEGLEQEIIKRNPTPVEKLEMRSLDSYPFNQKLSDYWADKDGAYDVMGNDKPKEYVLTKDEVDSGYNDVSLRKTFGVPDDQYDEEDIDGYEEEDF